MRIWHYTGERAVILGSRNTSGQAWEQWNSTAWRLNLLFCTPDPQYITASPQGFFLGSRRVPHRTVNDPSANAFSNSNASALIQNSWTIADANGYRCLETNITGCYLYYWPPTGEDPNSNVYELNQQRLFWRGTDDIGRWC